MIGFFSVIKNINLLTSELLEIGKTYSEKFKSAEIDANTYESEMIGKMYELTNKFSDGNHEVEKFIKDKFTDQIATILKTGISAYIENIKNASELATETVADISTNAENNSAPSISDVANEPSTNTIDKVLQEV